MVTIGVLVHLEEEIGAEPVMLLEEMIVVEVDSVEEVIEIEVVIEIVVVIVENEIVVIETKSLSLLLRKATDKRKGKELKKEKMKQ